MAEGQSADTSGARCRRTNSTLSKYGTTVAPHRDDAVVYPSDDNHSFFAKGRDFESAYVNHKYTTEERKTLATFESLDYLPSHSIVYKHWIRRQPPRLDWDRWLMMGLIGFTVGLIGFLLHQIIDIIADFKWDMANDFIRPNGDSLIVAWSWVLGYSLAFVALSAGLVVFLRPSAGGSGIPELIGFLNGTIVRHIFNIKTMVVKFLSCCAAVGSGLPVGPEGPMIHLGSLVGAGLSQFKSDTMKLKLPFFERFRNSEDRRNFISAGAAAGVASAFGAPVGGLLFSMEEVSSFWNLKLSWQIFFCAMIATFTTDLFNSAFTAFKYQGEFGIFKAEKYILFQVEKGIAVNILAFIPSAILGVIGGVLGALFTFINLKVARGRKQLLAKASSIKQKVIRMIEPLIIMVIVASVSVFLPSAFPCSQYTCIHGDQKQISPNCLNDKNNPLHIGAEVQQYTCPEGISFQHENYTWTNKTFNQVATLLFGTGETAIHHLFSRNTHLTYDKGPLAVVLVYYFLVACWTAGTSISSGLVVPMLFIGGLYGRILGRGMVDLFGVHTQEEHSYWAWIDPGAFALVGAASFFGGVSRLTISLTVIMIEITNDVQFLLPIMAAIMVAKWVGDFVTHPLYHALLELKCIPFLDTEPVIANEAKQLVNLELFCARDVMSGNPITVDIIANVKHLAQILLNTTHGGFPVLKNSSLETLIFFGFINRLELSVLLKQEDAFVKVDEADSITMEVTQVDYQSLTLDKLGNPIMIDEMLHTYCNDPKYQDLYINLEPYVNQSAISVPDKFSLHRTYIIFRMMGLRHITVVNENNVVVGVITRKDLMGFNMEEKLSSTMYRFMSQEESVVELTENVPSLS